MTHDALQDEFIKLRDQTLWLRQTVNTFNYLFDCSPETDRGRRQRRPSVLGHGPR